MFKTQNIDDSPRVLTAAKTPQLRSCLYKKSMYCLMPEQISSGLNERDIDLLLDCPSNCLIFMWVRQHLCFAKDILLTVIYWQFFFGGCSLIVDLSWIFFDGCSLTGFLWWIFLESGSSTDAAWQLFFDGCSVTVRITLIRSKKTCSTELCSINYLPLPNNHCFGDSEVLSHFLQLPILLQCICWT